MELYIQMYLEIIHWDLYDAAAESHDTVSFSHSSYWEMITNCDSENLSEFCNYFNSRYATNKDLALGKLLSYYKMSPSGLVANTGGATPSFSWTSNGTSSDLQNDKFDLIIFNVNDSEILCIENLTSTSYTLSDDEWETVLNSYGTTGSKLIQTFGTKDTTIELYSASGTLLVSSDETDDEGFRLNAFVRYYTYADTQYIIRVRLWNENSFGTTKIAITPAMGARVSDADTIECYEDIRTFDERTALSWSSYSQLNYTRVITFIAPQTGSYIFEITSEFDTYLYVIDPRSTDSLVRYTDFDDDSGEGLNAKLTRTLEAGIPYLIIYSGYNIENENHTGDLILKITAN